MSTSSPFFSTSVSTRFRNLSGLPFSLRCFYHLAYGAVFRCSSCAMFGAVTTSQMTAFRRSAQMPQHQLELGWSEISSICRCWRCNLHCFMFLASASRFLTRDWKCHGSILGTKSDTDRISILGACTTKICVSSIQPLRLASQINQLRTCCHPVGENKLSHRWWRGEGQSLLINLFETPANSAIPQTCRSEVAFLR